MLLTGQEEEEEEEEESSLARNLMSLNWSPSDSPMVSVISVHILSNCSRSSFSARWSSDWRLWTLLLISCSQLGRIINSQETRQSSEYLHGLHHFEVLIKIFFENWCTEVVIHIRQTHLIGYRRTQQKCLILELS